eukprot:1152977-Pelagomonas_calceolata.AAC.1
MRVKARKEKEKLCRQDSDKTQEQGNTRPGRGSSIAEWGSRPKTKVEGYAENKRHALRKTLQSARTLSC